MQKGVLQVRKNDFWFFSLVVLFVIACSTSWNMPLRIAVAANAIIVLIDCVIQIKGRSNANVK